MTPQELDRLGIDERKFVERALRNPTASPSLNGAESEITLALRLAAVNAAIWERENRIRAIRDGERAYDQLAFAGTIALEITRLNDWRAEIIGEEKIR